LSFALDSLRGQRHYAEYGGHHHKDRAEADKIDQFVTLWRLAVMDLRFVIWLAGIGKTGY
jgi:hypothetical protein